TLPMDVGSSSGLRITAFLGYLRCIPTAPTSPQFSLSPLSGQASLIGVLGRATKVTKMMEGSEARYLEGLFVAERHPHLSMFGGRIANELVLYPLAYRRLFGKYLSGLIALKQPLVRLTLFNSLHRFRQAPSLNHRSAANEMNPSFPMQTRR